MSSNDSSTGSKPADEPEKENDSTSLPSWSSNTQSEANSMKENPSMMAGPSIRRVRAKSMEYKCFPWLPEIHNAIRVDLKLDYRQEDLLKIIDLYTSFISGNLKCYIQYNNKSKLLAKSISKMLLLFKQLNSKFYDTKEYLMRVSDLLALYTTLELKVATKFDEQRKEVSSRINLNYGVHLQTADDYFILRVLINITKLFCQREVMKPIYEKYLMKSRAYTKLQLNDKMYVMYLIAFKQWKSLEDVEENRKIDDYANSFMKPKSTLRTNTFYAPHLPRYQPDDEDVTKCILTQQFYPINLIKAFKENEKVENDSTPIDHIVDLSISDEMSTYTNLDCPISGDCNFSADRLDRGVDTLGFTSSSLYTSTFGTMNKTIVKLEKPEVTATIDLTDDEDHELSWLVELRRKARLAEPLISLRATELHKKRSGDITEVIEIDDDDDNEILRSSPVPVDSGEPAIITTASATEKLVPSQEIEDCQREKPKHKQESNLSHNKDSGRMEVSEVVETVQTVETGMSSQCRVEKEICLDVDISKDNKHAMMTENTVVKSHDKNLSPRKVAPQENVGKIKNNARSKKSGNNTEIVQNENAEHAASKTESLKRIDVESQSDIVPSSLLNVSELQAAVKQIVITDSHENSVNVDKSSNSLPNQTKSIAEIIPTVTTTAENSTTQVSKTTTGERTIDGEKRVEKSQNVEQILLKTKENSKEKAIIGEKSTEKLSVAKNIVEKLEEKTQMSKRVIDVPNSKREIESVKSKTHKMEECRTNVETFVHPEVTKKSEKQQNDEPKAANSTNVTKSVRRELISPAAKKFMSEDILSKRTEVVINLQKLELEKEKLNNLEQMHSPKSKTTTETSKTPKNKLSGTTTKTKHKLNKCSVMLHQINEFSLKTKEKPVKLDKLVEVAANLQSEIPEKSSCINKSLDLFTASTEDECISQVAELSLVSNDHSIREVTQNDDYMPSISESELVEAISPERPGEFSETEDIDVEVATKSISPELFNKSNHDREKCPNQEILFEIEFNSDLPPSSSSSGNEGVSMLRNQTKDQLIVADTTETCGSAEDNISIENSVMSVPAPLNEENFTKTVEDIISEHASNNTELCSNLSVQQNSSADDEFSKEIPETVPEQMLTEKENSVEQPMEKSPDEPNVSSDAFPNVSSDALELMGGNLFNSDVDSSKTIVAVGQEKSSEEIQKIADKSSNLLTPSEITSTQTVNNSRPEKEQAKEINEFPSLRVYSDDDDDEIKYIVKNVTNNPIMRKTYQRKRNPAASKLNISSAPADTVKDSALLDLPTFSSSSSDGNDDDDSAKSLDILEESENMDNDNNMDSYLHDNTDDIDDNPIAKVSPPNIGNESQLNASVKNASEGNVVFSMSKVKKLSLPAHSDLTEIHQGPVKSQNVVYSVKKSNISTQQSDSFSNQQTNKIMDDINSRLHSSHLANSIGDCPSIGDGDDLRSTPSLLDLDNEEITSPEIDHFTNSDVADVAQFFGKLTNTQSKNSQLSRILQNDKLLDAFEDGKKGISTEKVRKTVTIMEEPLSTPKSWKGRVEFREDEAEPTDILPNLTKRKTVSFKDLPPRRKVLSFSPSQFNRILKEPTILEKKTYIKPASTGLTVWSSPINQFTNQQKSTSATLSTSTDLLDILPNNNRNSSVSSLPFAVLSDSPTRATSRPSTSTSTSSTALTAFAAAATPLSLRATPPPSPSSSHSPAESDQRIPRIQKLGNNVMKRSHIYNSLRTGSPTFRQTIDLSTQFESPYQDYVVIDGISIKKYYLDDKIFKTDIPLVPWEDISSADRRDDGRKTLSDFDRYLAQKKRAVPSPTKRSETVVPSPNFSRNLNSEYDGRLSRERRKSRDRPLVQYYEKPIRHRSRDMRSRSPLEKPRQPIGLKRRKSSGVALTKIEKHFYANEGLNSLIKLKNTREKNISKTTITDKKLTNRVQVDLVDISKEEEFAKYFRPPATKSTATVSGDFLERNNGPEKSPPKAIGPNLAEDSTNTIASAVTFRPELEDRLSKCNENASNIETHNLNKEKHTDYRDNRLVLHDNDSKINFKTRDRRKMSIGDLDELRKIRKPDIRKRRNTMTSDLVVMQFRKKQLKHLNNLDDPTSEESLTDGTKSPSLFESCPVDISFDHVKKIRRNSRASRESVSEMVLPIKFRVMPFDKWSMGSANTSSYRKNKKIKTNVDSVENRLATGDDGSPAIVVGNRNDSEVVINLVDESVNSNDRLVNPPSTITEAECRQPGSNGVTIDDTKEVEVTSSCSLVNESPPQRILEIDKASGKKTSELIRLAVKRQSKTPEPKSVAPTMSMCSVLATTPNEKIDAAKPTCSFDSSPLPPSVVASNVTVTQEFQDAAAPQPTDVTQSLQPTDTNTENEVTSTQECSTRSCTTAALAKSDENPVSSADNDLVQNDQVDTSNNALALTVNGLVRIHKRRQTTLQDLASNSIRSHSEQRSIIQRKYPTIDFSLMMVDSSSKEEDLSNTPSTTTTIVDSPRKRGRRSTSEKVDKQPVKRKKGRPPKRRRPGQTKETALPLPRTISNMSTSSNDSDDLPLSVIRNRITNSSTMIDETFSPAGFNADLRKTKTYSKGGLIQKVFVPPDVERIIEAQNQDMETKNEQVDQMSSQQSTENEKISFDWP